METFFVHQIHHTTQFIHFVVQAGGTVCCRRVVSNCLWKWSQLSVHACEEVLYDRSQESYWRIQSKCRPIIYKKVK